MPTAQEQFSRRLSGNAAEVTYTIFDAAADADALAELLATAPATHQGMDRDDEECEVELIRGLENIWIGNARYAADEGDSGGSTPIVTGTNSYRFETRGGTQHITQSLGTARYGTAPDVGGAIGATADSVEGTDITVPIYSFSETHAIPAADVTNAYKGFLVALTGRTNNASFRGLAAGECLFLGASGSYDQGDDQWLIDFAFAGSPNLTGLTVGDITGIAKNGWHYLWTRYEAVEDTTNDLLIRKPLGVYVEKVYRDGDFSGLGIGT
jgi:hypothetical protein